jgi:hypothetical protein
MRHRLLDGAKAWKPRSARLRVPRHAPLHPFSMCHRWTRLRTTPHSCALDLRLSRPKPSRHGRAPACRGMLRVDARGALRPRLRFVRFGGRVLGRLRTQLAWCLCEHDGAAPVSSRDGVRGRRLPRDRRHGGHPRPSRRQRWALRFAGALHGGDASVVTVSVLVGRRRQPGENGDHPPATSQSRHVRP